MEQQKDQMMLNISPERLFLLISEITGGTQGREDDDHPLPPGPWDPVIRIALRRSTVFGPVPDPWKIGLADLVAQNPNIYGPQPDPWKLALASILARHPEIYDAIGRGRRLQLGEDVSLNPQPLPPRYAFLKALVETVVSRAELMQEISQTASHDGSKEGIIIVGGYINRFVDDVCGNGFRLTWRFPGPRPHWYSSELTAVDLVILAMGFRQAAKEAYGEELQRSLATAGERLASEGLARMQGHKAEPAVMQKSA